MSDNRDNGNGDITYDNAAMIVKGAVEERIKEYDEDLHVSPELYAALGSRVDDLIVDASHRAEDNGRSTVMQRDL